MVDAFSESEAKLTALHQAPFNVISLGETIYNIETINEYEYKKFWNPLDPDIGPDQLKDQKDWVNIWKKTL